MKSKKTILLILIIIASMIPEARAITPQSQTVHITDTHDDMFITEVGIGIDSSLVTIKDPNMDIRAFLVFRELDINYWEPLKNATLRLHTSNTLSFDADSSISIYGMKLSDLQLEGYLLPSTVLSIGFTDAYTNYNTSEFYGSQWHEINVTSIVEELIRNPNWDGDGSAGTETGDAIGFHILGEEGDDKRYFYDYSVGNNLEAQLVIHWNHEPPPPAGYPDAVFNETYRGYNIWTIEGIDDENRTGQGSDVNWNILSLLDLTEQDSGADITVNNATWATVETMIMSVTDSLYNDTGSSNIDTYFLRFKVNITAVDLDGIGADAPAGSLYGLSTSAPSSSNGLSYGSGGNWVGLIIVVDNDDETYQIRIKERAGLVDWNGDATIWFNEAENTMKYWEVFTNMTGPDPYTRYSFYNDASFSDLNMTRTHIHFLVSGSLRYPQTIASCGTPGFSYWSGEYFTFNESQLAIGTTWLVSDENGTLIEDDLEDYDDAIIVIEDILGADPEDPNPPGEGWDETGPFTRFRTRLYILMMGFGLLFGPLIYFAMSRPSGYEFVIGLFIMLVGYSFLRAAAGI